MKNTTGSLVVIGVLLGLAMPLDAGKNTVGKRRVSKLPKRYSKRAKKGHGAVVCAAVATGRAISTQYPQNLSPRRHQADEPEPKEQMAVSPPASPQISPIELIATQARRAMRNCIFCSICEKHEDIVYENDDVFVIKDKYPRWENHFLIITKQHFVSAESLISYPRDISRNVLVAAEYLGNLLGHYKLDTNVGKGAGQNVGHLHWHFRNGEPLPVEGRPLSARQFDNS